MNKSIHIAVALVAGLSLAACAQDAGEKETIGTLAGAALGGLVGSQVGKGKGQLVGVGAGVLIGALLGREIGRSMDEADRMQAERTAQETLEYTPTGESQEWVNPDSGHSGTVTPTSTYQTAEQQYCREYQTTVTIGGKTEEAYGTACRQPDGSWKVVN